MQMGKLRHHVTITVLILLAIGWAFAQGRQRITPQTKPAASSVSQCTLNGTYRVDVVESDRLYSVVKNARSTVSFIEQQQFFMDLSTRLTPPDMLAIECKGIYVSVGSSRAGKITYLADGKNRTERLPNGGIVNSKITLDRDSLTFVSVGKMEDNVNVAFESLDDGKRLSVTRRIYAKQLLEPIIIQTFYDRISTDVQWNIYGSDLLAGQTASDRTAAPPRRTRAQSDTTVDALRADFSAWLDATNRRDVPAQMRFYLPHLQAYYLTRNTPVRVVLQEKERVFGAARSVEIRTGEPEIVFQNDGRTAIMRFRKEYRVAERSRIRQGVVIQELRWQQTNNGWRIFSERDVRVIR
jgi:hypothetical protein